MLNLVNNAKEAIKSDNKKKGRIRITALKEPDNIKIVVSDNGSGIPEAVIGQIFDPYFTTKEASGGTGIGLHIIHAIIKEHMHGDITVKNEQEGALFTLTIPVPKEYILNKIEDGPN
jgi:signal transduction histidine kinase